MFSKSHSIYCLEKQSLGVDVDFHCFRERQNQGKVNRKLDKRLKELMLQIEDERRNADQFKDQVIFALPLISFVCFALQRWVS